MIQLQAECAVREREIAIGRSKVLQLIRALDPKKAGGSDNISVSRDCTAANGR